MARNGSSLPRVKLLTSAELPYGGRAPRPRTPFAPPMSIACVPPALAALDDAAPFDGRGEPTAPAPVVESTAR